MKKPQFFTKKEEKPNNVPIEHKTLKKWLFTGKVLVIIFIILMAIYGIWSFNQNFYLQIPFRSPIVPRKHEVIISPVSSQSGKLNYIFDVGKIADKIYTLESSNGKNDSCTNLGLYNGYGWHQNSAEWKCYGSREQVREEVINWLTVHIKNGDIKTALCLYNRGVNESGCTYAIKFESL